MTSTCSINLAGEGSDAWNRFIHCDLLQIDLSRLSRQSRPSRALLIRIRTHATAHTPGVACVGLIVVVYEAPAEIYEPGVGGILGTRCRRPVASRLDVVKGMA